MPKFRYFRIRFILFAINVSLLSAVLLTVYSFSPLYSPSSSLFVVIIGLASFLNTIIFLLVVLELRRESVDSSSKMTQLRTKMLSYGYIGILSFIFLAGINTFLQQNINEPIFNLVYILSIPNNIIKLGIILAFYWSYFLPNWYRKREGLLVERVIPED